MRDTRSTITFVSLLSAAVSSGLLATTLGACGNSSHEQDTGSGGEAPDAAVDSAPDTAVDSAAAPDATSDATSDAADAGAMDAMDAMADAAAPAVGATTPFTSYEAEVGMLGGGAAVHALTTPPTTEYSSPSSRRRVTPTSRSAPRATPSRG